MKLQTESIGSIPRPIELIEAMQAGLPAEQLDQLYDKAVRQTLLELENTGSPVLTDGEQTKSSFATYPLSGVDMIVPGGMRIDFADGHFRQLPLLKKTPFRFGEFAGSYLAKAQSCTDMPLKQAVISASALSLIYPADGMEGYSQPEFISDLIDESEKDIRSCLEKGAHKVQIDFTEGRLSLKLDPSGGVLRHFIALNNQVLARFSEEEKARIGVHVCPGGDRDSTHSADVDYADLLAELFNLDVRNFYLQLASEPDRVKVLKAIKENLKPNQFVFVGVIDVLNPVVETAEEVRDRVLEAAQYIPLAQLGTTDDCGFSPFADDVSTSRETAFAKIKARIDGTRLAEEQLFA
ncbi:cobalamin-independent methionine synthase II family protein [Larkinella rosea]|uniref:5-methyltetrahydropteroyltriglutamate--homocysteine methyltransferase n=1 Tax=Larkinella rosea TaxID=2025312 RepID=A0A3P1BIB4_9BACT|nr:cobalamin-independent methionine synthase II family protein [Larkinella rosea]RRB00837.1 5-methyltetrahydropteroyltriglutamate--homocysteine methyltransferase [Larkinella rosea]